MRVRSLPLAILAVAIGSGLPATMALSQVPQTEQVAHAIKWVPIQTQTAERASTNGFAPVPASGQAHTFEALDIDADGSVQAAEWSLAAASDGVAPQVADAQFNVIDDNLDGALSEAEFESMSPSRFAGATSFSAEGQMPSVVHAPVVIYRVEGG